MLSTGFDEKSIGIHIDSNLIGTSQQTSHIDKKNILNKAGFEYIYEYVPDLIKSEWGLAYYVDNYHFRTETSSNSLLQVLLKSFKETKDWKRAITIFDFSKTTPRLIEQYYQHEPFNDIFLEDGRLKVIKGNYKNYDKTPLNVNIVHIGPQDHSIFIDFLGCSEIPVAITGDASLSETISLNKLFIYHPPGWKSHVFPNFVEKVPDILEDWQDIDRIRSLFGCRRVKQEDIDNYPKLEKFYIEYRKYIHRAKELEHKCLSKKDYRTKASHLFGKILREKDFKQAYELQIYFEENTYSLSMAYYNEEQGENKELEALKKKHIFGTGCGIMGDEETSRLFYDPEYQDSFNKFNQALIQKMNISKNLANLIRKSLKNYE